MAESKAQVIEELKNDVDYFGSKIHLYVETKKLFPEQESNIEEICDVKVNQLHRTWIYSNIIPANVDLDTFRYNIFILGIFINFYSIFREREKERKKDT